MAEEFRYPFSKRIHEEITESPEDESYPSGDIYYPDDIYSDEMEFGGKTVLVKHFVEVLLLFAYLLGVVSGVLLTLAFLFNFKKEKRCQPITKQP